MGSEMCIRDSDSSEFSSALNLCQSRARSAFGDDRVFVEKYIEGAQHIEFQVLADGKNAIHFGERFCSIQRRHQKLLEDGPWLSDEVRSEIGSKVCAGAEAVGYRGLATFEFLRDSNGDFYFLEVNPRVQVEHTVTEMITGEDMVQLGIRVAAGESLPLAQEDVKFKGHAIQFSRQEQIFRLRSKYLPVASALNRCGILIMWLIPFAGIFLRAPGCLLYTSPSPRDS